MIICYVGKDIIYSVNAVKIIKKQIPNIVIVGETADAVSKLLNFSSKIIALKRPWKDEGFIKITSGQLGVNCGFDYIIPKEVLMYQEIINIHPAYLPYNRGCHHSFWGVMEHTPLGATLHWMNGKLDSGPIITQKEFKDDGIMTAEDIQRISNQLCLDLLKENIQCIYWGLAQSKEQCSGTYHSKKDILKETTLDENDSISGGQFLDLCRATCNKNHGFFIKRNGELIKIIVKTVEKK